MLVRRIGSIEGLKRLRFGSIEPFAVDGRLLDAIAETETFCRHLHLPLQSGDDGVLAAMKRGYTAEGFRRITDSIRERLGSDIHLSTDLMVGFPGEDEKAFENSIGFVRRSASKDARIQLFTERRHSCRTHAMSGKDVRER